MKLAKKFDYSCVCLDMRPHVFGAAGTGLRWKTQNSVLLFKLENVRQVI